MKKRVSVISFVFLLAIFFTSCKDDMKNAAFENGSATINGRAMVNLDLTNDTIGIILEYAPAGTQIYATINSSDLIEYPSSTVNYGDIITSTQIAADGSFAFEIAANTRIVSVAFSSDDFLADQIQADSTVEATVFVLPGSFAENVSNGVTRYTEIIFIEK